MSPHRLDRYRTESDMPSVDPDGSHTTALRGCKVVGYSKESETGNDQCSLSNGQARASTGHASHSKSKRIKEFAAQEQEKSAEAAKSTEALDERQKDLDVKKNELDEIISETKQEEEKLRDKAKELETKIEPRLLQSFKRIRKNSRNGLGIVYVQRDACGGCFNKIPPQRQLDIRSRKKIIVCEYCGRIMIDPELAGVTLEHKEEVKEKPTRRRKTAE